MNACLGELSEKDSIEWMVNGNISNNMNDDDDDENLDGHVLRKQMNSFKVVLMMVPSDNYNDSDINRKKIIKMNNRFQTCRVYDGKHCVNVFVDMTKGLQNQIQMEGGTNNKDCGYYGCWRVQVNGYVRSDNNNCDCHASRPFVCVTDYEILHSMKLGMSPCTVPSLDLPRSKTNMAGKFVNIWKCQLSNLPLRDLVGIPNKNDGPGYIYGKALDFEQLELFTDFLIFCQTQQSFNRFTNDPSYAETIILFNQSQKDCVLTNDKNDSDLLSYQQALNKALQHATDAKHPPLTPKTICSWHKQLLFGSSKLKNSNENVSQITSFRNEQLRCGSTEFTQPQIIEVQLHQLFEGLKILETQLFASTVTIHNKETLKQHGEKTLLFAAVALFGIYDIHPYLDGNGRLIRIVANWALHRAGFPFEIHIFDDVLTKSDKESTEINAHRKDWDRALFETLKNTNLIGMGSASNNDTFQLIQRRAGIFQPLVKILLNRITKVVKAFQKSFRKRKNNEIAQLFRNQASVDTCFICFEDKPNVATLCCGKAVHFTCMAKWLKSHSSCPQCRGEFPSLPSNIFDEPTSNNVDRNTSPFHRLHNMIATMYRYEDGADDDDDDDTFSSPSSSPSLSSSSSLSPAEVNPTWSFNRENREDLTISLGDAIQAHNERVSIRAQNQESSSDGSEHNDHEYEEQTTNREENDSSDISSCSSRSCSRSSTSRSRSRSCSSNSCISYSDHYNSSFDDDRNSRFCLTMNCENEMEDDCENHLCGQCCLSHGRNACARHGNPGL